MSEPIPAEAMAMLADLLANVQPDADQARARDLVKRLHDVAERTPGTKLGDMLSEAACVLDGYQAGLSLATPHPASPWRLVKKGEAWSPWQPARGATP